ncbi:hypothetical protein H5410_030190, partial [Solanum commersonii]
MKVNGDGRKIALRHGTITEEVTYFCFVAPQYLIDILICPAISLGVYSNYSNVMEDEELPNP